MAKEKTIAKELPSIKVVCLAHSPNTAQPRRRIVRDEHGDSLYSITLTPGQPFALVGDREIATVAELIRGGTVNEVELGTEHARQTVLALADKSAHEELTRLRTVIRELAGQLYESGKQPAYTIDNEGVVVEHEVEELVS